MFFFSFHYTKFKSQIKVECPIGLQVSLTINTIKINRLFSYIFHGEIITKETKKQRLISLFGSGKRCRCPATPTSL